MIEMKVTRWIDQTEKQRKGTLSLLSLSSCIYIVRYSDEEEEKISSTSHSSSTSSLSSLSSSLTLSVRLDCVSIASETHQCLMIVTTERQVFLQCLHSVDFHQFIEGINLCRQICHLSLDLNVFYRDMFVGGFLTRAPMEKLDIKKYNSYAIDCAKSILTSNIPIPEKVVQPIIEKPPPPPIMATAPVVQILQYTKTHCIYCDKSDTTSICSLKIHPYLPVDSELRVLYFCLPCHANYLSYRQEAYDNDLLVLPGEVNEEICACCSDSPSNLVLCSSCPRSFCEVCLHHLLSLELYQRMLEDKQWKCMCCVIPTESLKKICQQLLLPYPLNGGIKLRKGSLIKNENPPQQIGIKREKLTTSTENQSIERQLSSTQPARPKFVQTISEVLRINPAPTPPRPAEKIVQVQQTTSLPKEEKKKPKKQNSPMFQPILPLHVQVLKKYEPGLTPNTSQNLKSRESQLEIQQPPKRLRQSHSLLNDDTRSNAEPALSPSSSIALTSSNLPPVDGRHDETYYFSQYTEYLDERALDSRNPSMKPPESFDDETEDYCFLCKDGGELIECDFRRKQIHSHCKKVYHSYCLGYNVEENENDSWKCLRHYCSDCGGCSPAILCRYCPSSYCEDCFMKWAEANKSQPYGILNDSFDVFRNRITCLEPSLETRKTLIKSIKSEEDEKKMNSSVGKRGKKSESSLQIICGTCVRMIGRCQVNQRWDSSKHPSFCLVQSTNFDMRENY